MRRLPDSSPRISRRLRFPIAAFLLFDLAMGGLLAVVYLTPLSPGVPVGQPLRPDNTPHAVQTVVLPAAITSSAPRSTTLAPVPAATVHWAAPTAHKPATTRSAPSSPAPVRSSQPPAPVPSPQVTRSLYEPPSSAPPDTGTPDPTGSG